MHFLIQVPLSHANPASIGHRKDGDPSDKLPDDASMVDVTGHHVVFMASAICSATMYACALSL